MGFFIIMLLILVTYYIGDWLYHLPKVNNYSYKFIVVTDCGSSCGRRLALHLHGLGFHVFAGCPDQKSKDVLAQVKSPRLVTAMLDVTHEESVASFVTSVKQRIPEYAGIWALINNASVLGNTEKTEHLTTQDYLDVFDVNLLGTVDMTRTLLPLIRKAQGRIVNTSSVYGRLGYQFAPFSASSYGLEAFSDVLRQEVYRQGINVSIVEPGSTRTDEKPDSRTTSAEIPAQGFASSLKRTFFNVYEHGSSNQKALINAYTHAVTAELPRTRYVIGWDAKFVAHALCLLPDFITDRVVQAAMRSSAA